MACHDHEADAPCGKPVAPNYLYWRQHGLTWAEEYDTRKRSQPLYHIQELMLVDYFIHHAPARVLEFGCGPGRHLKNLSRIRGIEIFGYDQSRSIVQGCLEWTSQQWIDQHVEVGEPVGPLPYEDSAFDIVFTAEVLVHVRPEDLDGILTELVRVCKGHVLHLETSEHHKLAATVHAGCWKHDLVGAYARLGRHCEVLSSGYAAHTPYRVAVGEPGPGFVWSPDILSLYRRLEEDLNQGLENLTIERENFRSAWEQQKEAADRLGQQERQARERLAQSEATCSALQSKCAELEQQARWAEAQLARLNSFVRRVNQALPGR